MAVFDKKVLRIETRTKNDKKWTCVVMEGKDPGVESEHHIFDPATAKQFRDAGPGAYSLEFAKNGNYWNVVKIVKAPERQSDSAPHTGNTLPIAGAPTTRHDILVAAIMAAGHVYGGKGTLVGADFDALTAAIKGLIRDIVYLSNDLAKLKP